ncbi:hypothetical protein BABINDRAFT_159231 [Babjeviella inositovora NRRL Y-12698]|uniref:Threonylcarbamoyl-AMP synthase n=1 Tax=Babjeviella inositovora NRRL Y-12698 TaxID=984486 RepID=A0A1E3QYK3_9ASCO|nr:uncharacterized protein BABINDRAFT_159231 [Babjeviella inositovora NRRL Y-12698]ODQ82706.1 hypothetical protein BABINDRAFT_159231 [Babjeviella inositovora NRRL Y-12698]
MNTRILPVDTSSITFGSSDEPIISDAVTRKNLLAAAAILHDTTDVVGFPTETVYGLGGSALSDESVRSIYRAKNRPADNPLIVHVSSLSQLKRKILPEDYEIPEIYTPLLAKFWPGPLTILLPVFPSSPLSLLVTANQPTFAVRIPAHPVARALIALSDTPIAAPSANASTRPSPTLASHVYADLQGRIPMILDGGACDVGVESTVVDGLVSPPMLLRPGGISVEDIRKFGGLAWENVVLAKKTAGKMEAVRTPGMKYRHYSPKAKVVLFVNSGTGARVEEYIIKNGLQNKKCALLKSRFFESSPLIQVERDMGTTGADISRNLFAMLREVDEMGVDVIFVEGIDESNEGLAVMNRLSKAAGEIVDGGL